ncbi:MAG: NAD(P)/FAD-dependent oxidoreductase [Lawsonibacter sp.]
MSQIGHELVVVGGGAAGMMAAITAARLGADVCLVERNPKLGRKLYITGKGRCNVTNHCTPEEVLAATPRNGKFLYSAMNQTPPAEVERFFTELGVELKVERGNRVFPVSDRSADIIDALFFELRRLSVPVIQGRVSALDVQDGAVCAVELRQDGEGQKKIPCRGVVLATGGASYPATGSTGDGYELARSAGHSVVPPRPSLVPLEAEEGFCGEMQGLALKNVALRMKDRKGKVLFQEQGELLFTHFGLSGPLILSASAHLRDFEKEQLSGGHRPEARPGRGEAGRPAAPGAERTTPTRTMQNVMGSLVPRLMVPVALRLADIPLDREGPRRDPGERRRLLETLKGLTHPHQGAPAYR